MGDGDADGRTDGVVPTSGVAEVEDDAEADGATSGSLRYHSWKWPAAPAGAK